LRANEGPNASSTSRDHDQQRRLAGVGHDLG